MQKGLTRNSLIALFILVAVITSWLLIRNWLRQVGFIPIEVVAFSERLHYEDPDLIRGAVGPLVAKGFFACDVRQVKASLEQLPWIAQADVQRKWPNKIQIRLFEHKPLAVWEGKGVINTEGHLFFPQTVANVDEIPHFFGSEEYVDDMVDVYSLLHAKLEPIGLTVQKLAILPECGWKALLSNGVTLILGQVELDERLQRFVLAYTGKLSAEVKNIKVIDLRYTNGLAVG